MKAFDYYNFMRSETEVSQPEIVINEGVATIFIYDVIDDRYGINLNKLSEKIPSIEAKEIHVRINSPGGLVYQGQAFLAVLKDHPASFTTIIDGIAASTAATIGMAGDSVKMSSGASMFIHNPWRPIIGDYKAMRQAANQLEEAANTLQMQYAKYTKSRNGINIEEIKRLMDAETLMSAEMALEKGFIDEIVPLIPDKPDKSDPTDRAEFSPCKLKPAPVAGFSLHEGNQAVQNWFENRAAKNQQEDLTPIINSLKTLQEELNNDTAIRS